jgi:hypothetical protein
MNSLCETMIAKHIAASITEILQKNHQRTNQYVLETWS